MDQPFSTIPEAIAAIAGGEVVIVVDAEDRENEGDYICAAELATTQAINFMLDGRGQLCLSVLPDVADRLALSPVVAQNTAPLSTAFMTAIDHSDCRTGITAAERALTIREAVRPDAAAADFVRPGHVSPLLARQGGVLERNGHTEAAMDLARLAGLTPAGALCEILNAQGDRATRDEMFATARKYNLVIVSIEQLIQYRRQAENTVTRIAEAKLPSRHGELTIVAYDAPGEREQPVALVMGDLSKAAAPLVRMHSSCFTGDLVDSLRCDCGGQLSLALEMIARDGVGAVVYLPQEGRGIGLAEKVKAYALQDTGLDTVEANLALGHTADARDYSVGVQILKDLGARRVRLLTNNPKKIEAIQRHDTDIEVVDQVPVLPPVTSHCTAYLDAKREKMGHLLPFSAAG